MKLECTVEEFAKLAAGTMKPLRVGIVKPDNSSFKSRVYAILNADERYTGEEDVIDLLNKTVVEAQRPAVARTEFHRDLKIALHTLVSIIRACEASPCKVSPEYKESQFQFVIHLMKRYELERPFKLFLEEIGYSLKTDDSGPIDTGSGD